MHKRDIIVIGASAGGIEAVATIMSRLPRDLAASVFVVVHIPPFAPSHLPGILTRSGPLPAVHPQDGETIEPRRIYVAPPDKHMLIEAGRVVVRRGPKENRFRPSIDALFRSAAYVYGPRVIGVVLSGVLDDGTSGLWSIKRLGGVALAQKPEDALHPEMPRSALTYVECDHVGTAAELGALLGTLVGHGVPSAPDIDHGELRRLRLEVEIAMRDNAFEKGIMAWGDMATFTCPECHGALVKVEEGAMTRYRCHTGHAFTASALLAGITEAVEVTLLQAMRGLEEQTLLLEHLAKHFDDAGNKQGAELFRQKARKSREQAQTVHDSLPDHELFSQDGES
jgi:two-component system chemotaxis response regulator CheB